MNEVEENALKELALSVDFQCYPKEDLVNLERSLKMTDFRERPIVSKIDKFYGKQNIEAPGIDPDDITQAILGAND